ncbi:sugar transporter, putative [Metarhizium acridum CQMa 102]|uniref:Sugar transporter, putative n=1 Tax=Metarhizium acridum (strain CQMa 102) TaxID=655827 RepID=E9DVT2_METAQ|nr:sugar transporter, putative [Metarhizium acridum CQMa 102]EFY92129.1 sugar transporter, putative [Metarhizium acridum CQMa 102]
MPPCSANSSRLGEGRLQLAMLRSTPSGTWLPSWTPESTSTLSVLLTLCSVVQSTTGGYDGSMLNGLNILPSYTDYFRLTSATQGLNTASVFIGGFFGPMVGGVMSDKLGRRPALFWASVITMVGIVLQSAAQNVAMFVVARIILGFGGGISNVAAPLLNNFYYIGALIAAGVTLESPRWLIRQDRYEDARLVVAQTNADGNLTDPVAMTVYKEIVDTLEWEKKQGRSMSPMEIFQDPVARKRVLVGGSTGPFSCIAGNIIASYYLGNELSTAGVKSSDDQLRSASNPQSLLEGLLIACLFIIGGLSKIYADNPGGASKGLIYGDVAVMFLFQGFYSIAWTPLLTLYPPEVMDYPARANGVAFSQFTLNGLAMLLVFVMPIGLNNTGWRMYMINGSWDIITFLLIAVFWVETKGKTLEEIDAIFERERHSSEPNVEDVRKGE